MTLPAVLPADDPHQEESPGAEPGEIIKACDIKAMVEERNLSLERHLFAFHLSFFLVCFLVFFS